MRHFVRQLCRVALLSCFLGVTASAALAQAYPNKPIKLIVPFAPGGFTDVVARILGQKLSVSLGQPFVIENKKVILIDDVLATGRMVRAAIDAMQAFGRPEKVELLCLINRRYERDLPIQPDYTGMRVNTLDTQRVLVEWKEQGNKEDKIWLIG